MVSGIYSGLSQKRTAEQGRLRISCQIPPFMIRDMLLSRARVVVLELDALVVLVAVGMPVRLVHAIFAVVGEVGKAESSSLLLIAAICSDESLPIAAILAAEAVSYGAGASPSLHTAASLEAGNHVGSGGIGTSSSRNQQLSVGVASREVEKVDAREGDQEATQQ